MTFRTRTVEKRGRRRSSSMHADARRSLLVTFGFGFGIVAAFALLGGVLFASWYTDHWATVMTVNGKSYSVDDVKARMALIGAEDAVVKQTYMALRNANKISDADFSNFTNSLTNLGTVGARAQSQLQDDAIIADYAAKNGISVSDGDTDAQMTKDATTPELRHIKVIAVMPTPAVPGQGATAAEISAAQTKAQGLHDRIVSGAKWDDVAKEANAGFLAGPSGDIGTAAKDDFRLDPPLLDAAFNLKNANDVTDVIKSSDGIFRFATVESIVPPSTNSNYQSQLQSNGGSVDALRSQARAEALRAKVEQQVDKTYIESPTKQRHVLDMYFNAGYNPSSTDEVKSRVAIFAPDRSTETATSVAADDPKWADAKKRADDFYAQVKADPAKFGTLATTQSDDKIFRDGGGETPFLPESTFGDQSSGGFFNWGDLGKQLFDPSRKAGDLIGPIKLPVGYGVAVFEAKRPGPNQRLAAAQIQLNSGADFDTVARELSDSAMSDFGWVSPYMLGSAQTNAIFQAKVGDIVKYSSPDGSTYLYKTIAEETRTPDADQAARLKNVVFGNWLSDVTSKATITKDDAKLSSITNPTTPSSSGQ